jgi:diguanylate cyclase (GGDEF)-like protein
MRGWPGGSWRKERWSNALTLGLSLRTRIILSAILPVVTLAGFFFYTSITQKQLSLTTHDILDNRIVTMHAAERIKQLLVAYDDALFRYLAVHDSAQLVEGRRFKEEMGQHLVRLSQLSANPVLNGRMELLRMESQQYFEDAQQLLDYSRKYPAAASALQQKSAGWTRETGREHLELAFLSEEGKARLIRITALCDEIVTVNRLELERAKAEMNAVLERTRRTGILLSLATIGMLAFLSAGFLLSVLYPLRNLMGAIRQIEEGDLEVQIPVTTLDEVGELTQAFNRATRLIHHQREQLLRDTVTDGLTGTYNQRYFRKMLHQELERAHRTKDPVSLLMIDLDHFKHYNDTMGHEFGNELLKKVGALIRESLREVDLVARYGGDEFVVILPQTNAEEARPLAQRILNAVAACGLRWPEADGSQATLSLSIGGASFPQHGHLADMIIQKADAALYAAKRSGRNRVQWASEEIPNAPISA